MIPELINAGALGAQYALLALGLAAVFSVLGLINFAHGELITIPAYVMLGLYSIGVPWAIFAPVGVLAGGVAAVAMERLAFRPLRGAAPTTLLLTSFGLAIVIQALLASLVSPRPKAVPQPDWLTSSIELGAVTVKAYQLLAMGLTAVALGAMLALLRRSLIGVAMRAAAEDFDATRLMGVRANRVVATTFAISGLLAGLAAVITLARRGTVEPTMGLAPVLVAFVATVVGGIGNLKGAVAGGFLLGLVETALRTYLPDDLTGFTQAFLFSVIAGLLLFKPGGLFEAKAAVRV